MKQQMKRRQFLFSPIILAVLLSGLSGCAHFTESATESVTEDNVRIIRLTRPPKSTQRLPSTHQVKKGESLFRIARRYDLDYRKLAEWNNVQGNYVISPGQQLILKPPTGQSANKKQITQEKSTAKTNPAAVVPASAPAKTNAKKNSATKSVWPTKGRRRYTASEDGKGLLVSTQPAGRILAVREGKVVYVGDELQEYGMMILVSHAGGYLTVYARNIQPVVEEGQSVAVGAHIAAAGANDKGTKVFYFEARKDGKPVDALSLLNPP